MRGAGLASEYSQEEVGSKVIPRKVIHIHESLMVRVYLLNLERGDRRDVSARDKSFIAKAKALVTGACRVERLCKPKANRDVSG